MKSEEIEQVIKHFVPANVQETWRKQEATKVATRRKTLIADRGDNLAEETKVMPALRQTTATERANAELARDAYIEAEVAARKAYAAECSTLAKLENQRNLIES